MGCTPLLSTSQAIFYSTRSKAIGYIVEGFAASAHIVQSCPSCLIDSIGIFYNKNQFLIMTNYSRFCQKETESDMMALQYRIY